MKICTNGNYVRPKVWSHGREWKKNAIDYVISCVSMFMFVARKQINKQWRIDVYGCL